MEHKTNRSLYKIIIALIILIMVVTFSIQNNKIAKVSLWFWETETPLIILFLICFIAGLFFAILGIIPTLKNSRRKSKLIEEMKERIDLLEKENSNKTN